MPRRALVTTLLALVLSTLTVAVPSATGAGVTREISMRPDAVTGAVTRTRVVTLERPAETVVAYWRGNPHAVVTLALSRDGATFGPRAGRGT